MVFPLNAEILPVQLVSVYQSNVQVSEYLVSEKYDGVRAIWKAGNLVTKNGNKITDININKNGIYEKPLPDSYRDFFIDEELRLLEL